MPTFDGSTASVHVLTEKEGVLSAVAHDLELEVTDFTVTVEGTTLTARFDPRSLRVLHALKQGKPTTSLSARDRRDIEANLARDVLARREEITFRSTSLERSGGDAQATVRVAGTLRLNGVSRALAFTARTEGGALVADVPLHQPDFGIQPFSAMLGALRVKPGVVVRIRVPAW